MHCLIQRTSWQSLELKWNSHLWIACFLYLNNLHTHIYILFEESILMLMATFLSNVNVYTNNLSDDLFNWFQGFMSCLNLQMDNLIDFLVTSWICTLFSPRLWIILVGSYKLYQKTKCVGTFLKTKMLTTWMYSILHSFTLTSSMNNDADFVVLTISKKEKAFVVECSKKVSFPCTLLAFTVVKGMEKFI